MLFYLHQFNSHYMLNEENEEQVAFVTFNKLLLYWALSTSIRLYIKERKLCVIGERRCFDNFILKKMFVMLGGYSVNLQKLYVSL